VTASLEDALSLGCVAIGFTIYPGSANRNDMYEELREMTLEAKAAGPIVVGGINLGGTIDPVYNAVSVVELAIEKGAALVLMPVSARKQLNDLSDDMATKVDVVYYRDAKDALLKAVSE